MPNKMLYIGPEKRFCIKFSVLLHSTGFLTIEVQTMSDSYIIQYGIVPSHELLTAFQTKIDWTIFSHDFPTRNQDSNLD